MSQKNFARGIFWMILASSSFAIMAAAAKYCGRRLPVPEIILVRSLLSSIFIAFLIFKTKISWRARGDPLPRPTCREQRLAAWVGKNPTILASRGAVGFVALTLYFWAVSRLDLGTAVMLNYTSPMDRFSNWLMSATFDQACSARIHQAAESVLKLLSATG